MDFTTLHLGASTLAVTIASALNLSFAPVNPSASDAALKYPQHISSFNLDGEIAKPEVSDLVTVEEPAVVYTVTLPTPKPSTKPVINQVVEETKATTGTEVEAPEPSSTPAVLTSSNADKMFQMANEHRAKLGKASLQKDDRLCKIAEARAPQINGELSTGDLHKGFKELNLPYWATENIAAYSTIEENFKFWIGDYIHRVAIEGDHKYSCVACDGSSCSQIFSSFVNK